MVLTWWMGGAWATRSYELIFGEFSWLQFHARVVVVVIFRS